MIGRERQREREKSKVGIRSSSNFRKFLACFEIDACGNAYTVDVEYAYTPTLRAAREIKRSILYVARVIYIRRRVSR